MGMAAILVMWPGPVEQTFVPPSHGGSIWNLASIGPVVSEEKMFENVDVQRTAEACLYYKLRWTKKSASNGTQLVPIKCRLFAEISVGQIPQSSEIFTCSSGLCAIFLSITELKLSLHFNRYHWNSTNLWIFSIGHLDFTLILYIRQTRSFDKTSKFRLQFLNNTCLDKVINFTHYILL